MLKIMTDLPDSILGVSAEGKITGSDYEIILIPAVEEKFKTNKKVNLLYHLGKEFSGFELSAILDDTKIGMKHLSSWGRIALVSDHEIINTFAKFFGYLLCCEIRVFKDAKLAEAKEWVSD